jgi:hypothetical protein
MRNLPSRPSIRAPAPASFICATASTVGFCRGGRRSAGRAEPPECVGPGARFAAACDRGPRAPKRPAAMIATPFVAFLICASARVHTSLAGATVNPRAPRRKTRNASCLRRGGRRPCARGPVAAERAARQALLICARTPVQAAAGVDPRAPRPAEARRRARGGPATAAREPCAPVAAGRCNDQVGRSFDGGNVDLRGDSRAGTVPSKSASTARNSVSKRYATREGVRSQNAVWGQPRGLTVHRAVLASHLSSEAAFARGHGQLPDSASSRPNPRLDRLN